MLPKLTYHSLRLLSLKLWNYCCRLSELAFFAAIEWLLALCLTILIPQKTLDRELELILSISLFPITSRLLVPKWAIFTVIASAVGPQFSWTPTIQMTSYANHIPQQKKDHITKEMSVKKSTSFHILMPSFHWNLICSDLKDKEKAVRASKSNFCIILL